MVEKSRKLDELREWHGRIPEADIDLKPCTGISQPGLEAYANSQVLRIVSNALRLDGTGNELESVLFDSSSPSVA